MKKLPITLVLLTTVFFLSGCITFYKVNSVEEKNSTTPLYQYNDHRYQFVVHTGDLLWALNDVEIYSEHITGIPRELGSDEYNYYKKLGENRKNGRVPWFDKTHIYQVHIFADKFSRKNGVFNIKDKDIRGINIYNINTQLTVLAGVGTASLASVAALGIFLAIVCNCPHVYTFDGETYQYNNTMFTGAISSVIERYDYKILPDYKPDASNYKLLIKNEDEEKQYTNHLQLVVAHHKPNVEVLPDQKGKLYSVEKTTKPISVWNDENINVEQKIEETDDVPYTFNSISEEGLSNLYASFNIDNYAENAGLVLSVNNSKWGGYVYNEFSKLFGRYHDNWVRKNQKKSREEMENSVQEQGINLVVSIKKDNLWVEVEKIDLIGDAAYHKLVIPIDKEYFTDGELEVRLQSGYMFWRLDFLAFNPGSEESPLVEHPVLKIASDNNNKNLVSLIQNNDKSYMEHQNQGDSTYLEFSNLNSYENMDRTIILQSKGYYVSEKKIKGKPDFSQLKNFKEPAALSRYSKQLYDNYFFGMAINF